MICNRLGQRSSVDTQTPHDAFLPFKSIRIRFLSSSVFFVTVCEQTGDAKVPEIGIANDLGR